MYGVCVVIGILLVILYLIILEKRYRTFAAQRELCIIFSGIGAVIGAKLLYILTALPAFWNDLCSAPFGDVCRAYLSGGFVFYGGLYGGLLAACLYIKRSRLSSNAMLSWLVPIIPLFHAAGRVGCFCAGCCYGIPSETCGIVFLHSPYAPNNVPLLPVQLIESGFLILLFSLLLILRKKKCCGQFMLGIYLLLYGAGRFLLEFLRGDEIRGIVYHLSTSQYISLPTVFLGIVLIVRYRKNRANV